MMTALQQIFEAVSRPLREGEIETPETKVLMERGGRRLRVIALVKVATRKAKRLEKKVKMSRARKGI